jgi:ribosomal protein S18 acetylase RimI-like enzyme
MASTWRDAIEADDAALIQLCGALNEEDPGPQPVPATHMVTTLRTFREEPVRGKAVVLEVDGAVVGYALLVSFWSNELGGEVCTVDELYVAPSYRSSGHGTVLFDELSRLWGRPYAAVGLETMPTNERARAFYRRIGFEGDNVAMVRRH